MTSTPRRVAYWLSEKKQRNLRLREFATFCRDRGMTLVQLDLDGDLDAQGPFDCIFHKLSDVYAKSEQGDVDAQRQWGVFNDYVRAHGDMPVLDPPEAIGLLCSRLTQYEFLASLCEGEEGVSTPSFVQLTSPNGHTNVSKVRLYGLQYPLVCKPLQAHGSVDAHQIRLVFNAEGLAQLRPPFMAQTFLPHSATLFKLFVLGGRHYVTRRPSLKDYDAHATRENMLFDSQTVSKAGSTHEMTVMEEGTPVVEDPPAHVLARFVDKMRRRSGLSLFGVDIIASGGRYYAIDVNVFPSYDGVPELFAQLHGTIAEAVREATATDSGVGTASESDSKDTQPSKANESSTSFPNWQRIKRFYGIPKPQHAPPLPPPRRSRQKAAPLVTPVDHAKTRTNSVP